MLGGGNNKGVMSVIYGAIVFAITIVFVVQFRPNSGQKAGKITQECVATIRDRCVTPKEYHAEYGLLAPRGVDENKLSQMGIRRLVMNGIVERELLNQDAKRLGITVSDAEINRQVARGRFHVSLPVAREGVGRWLGLNGYIRMIPVNSRKTKKFSYKTYKRMVRLYTNRSPVEFKAMQRRELIADRMRKLIRSRATVTEEEAFDAFQRTRTSAKLDYVRLHRSYFLARYVDTSAKQVEAWAKDHEEQIDAVWKQRKSAYPAGCRRARHILIQIKSGAAPDGHSREEAKKLIDEAKARLEKGEPFSAVASDVSEDKSSASKGGDLGCFKEGKFPKPFEQAVFGAKDPGFIDQVVESPYGFHLIDVTLITSKDEKKADQQGRMDVAKDMMIAAKLDEVMKAAGTKIRETVEKGKKLQDAIDAAMKSLDEQYGVEDKKEKKDKESDETSDDKPADYPSVNTTGTFTRVDDSPMDDVAPGQNVIEMAFNLEKPGQVAKKLVKMTDGYSIIALRESHVATKREFKKEREDYINRLRDLKGHDLLVNYVQHLREQAQAQGALKISERWAQEPKKTKEQ